MQQDYYQFLYLSSYFYVVLKHCAEPKENLDTRIESSYLEFGHDNAMTFPPYIVIVAAQKKYSRFLCNYSFLFVVPFTITFKISKKRLNSKPSNKAAKNISHGKNSHALTKIFCKHTLIGIGKLPIEKFDFQFITFYNVEVHTAKQIYSIISSEIVCHQCTSVQILEGPNSLQQTYIQLNFFRFLSLYPI